MSNDLPTFEEYWEWFRTKMIGNYICTFTDDQLKVIKDIAKIAHEEGFDTGVRFARG